MDNQLQALTEAAIDLVKDQGEYMIVCEINDQGKAVVVSWGDKITPPANDVLATKTAERLAQLDCIKNRVEAYPKWGTQLDYIYHNGIDKWKTDIVDPVKKKYPKP